MPLINREFFHLSEKIIDDRSMVSICRLWLLINRKRPNELKKYQHMQQMSKHLSTRGVGDAVGQVFALGVVSVDDKPKIVWCETCCVRELALKYALEKMHGV